MAKFVIYLFLNKYFKKINGELNKGRVARHTEQRNRGRKAGDKQQEAGSRVQRTGGRRQRAGSRA